MTAQLHENKANIVLDCPRAVMYTVSMETAISKTQKRAVKLLNLQTGDTYESAKLALETAGYRGDAIPQGKTWRDAAKMSDDDLLSAIRESEEDRWYRMHPERPDQY